MRILILGGTGLLGRHLAKKSLALGHPVTPLYGDSASQRCCHKPST